MKAPGLLEIARRREGLTGTELAEKMGVPRTLLSEVERGHRIPTADFRAKAASALGVAEESLFPQYWFLTAPNETGIRVCGVEGAPRVYRSRQAAERAAKDLGVDDSLLQVRGPADPRCFGVLLGADETAVPGLVLSTLRTGREAAGDEVAP